MRKALWWIGGLGAVIIAVLVYLVLTGERGLGLRTAAGLARTLDVIRLDDDHPTDLFQVVPRDLSYPPFAAPGFDGECRRQLPDVVPSHRVAIAIIAAPTTCVHLQVSCLAGRTRGGGVRSRRSAC